MTKIAIIGGGFAGLATCWECLEKGYTPTLYDPRPLGGGTSGMAAGLLHPFTGLDAKLAWRGFEAMDAAVALLGVASGALGKPCYSMGIQRIALTERQIASYSQTAELYPSYVRWEEPNLFIPQGYAVHAHLYLQGLWQRCVERGAVWVQERVTHLPDADAVIIAAGYETDRLPYCEGLALHPVKGQLLEYQWDPTITQPKYAINAVGYLMMTADKAHCIVGSTYEHNFASADPDPTAAIPWLMPRILPFFPEIAKLRLTDCRAGVRATTADHKPIVKKVGPNTWVLTGLGSKGLLYSALLAKDLISTLPS